MQPRLDLTAQGYLWWCAPAVYPLEFIYEHPEIVEKKIQANLAFPSQLHAYQAQLAALGPMIPAAACHQFEQRRWS